MANGYFRKCLLRSLIVAALALGSGCSLPKAVPSGIIGPVEETIAALKERAEIKHQMETLQPPKEVESVSAGRYAYDTLSEEEKLVYGQMLDGILKQEEQVTLSTTDEQVLEKLYNCIRADYGGLFWVGSYRYMAYQKGDETKAIVFSPDYKMSYEQRQKVQKKIDRKVDAYLNGIDQEASDYEKAAYVYRKLIQKVDYNLDAEDNQSIISVFLNKETVCQGYAAGTQYLLERLGIPSTIVTGRAGGGSHAWNLVLLDGDWYYMDTTWGNSEYRGDDEQSVKFVEYDYLNITSEELEKDHWPNVEFPLPRCTAVKDNYYVQEEKYFSNFDEASIAAVGEIMRQAYESGEHSASMKFDSWELCRRFREYFLQEHHIGEYCKDIREVYYSTSAKLNVFTIIFP